MKNSEVNKQSRLARECEKLDKVEERSFADFGLPSETNWEKIETMKNEDIDFTDLPEVSIEMFAKGI